MIDFEELIAERGSSNWQKESPGSPSSIQLLQQECPFPLPAEYVEFLLYSDGAYAELPVDPLWCVLFPANKVMSTNILWGTFDDLPGYLVIGTNGGGCALLFKVSEGSWPVYWTDEIYFGLEPELVANSFIEFVCMLGRSEDSVVNAAE